MVREIGVHDDDEAARRVFQTVDISGAQAELAGTGFQDDVRRGVEGLELLGDGEGAVGGAVVDDDNFPVEVVFGEGAGEEPDYDGEVSALVVGGKDDAVFFFGRHGGAGEGDRKKRGLGSVNERGVGRRLNR